MIGAGWAQVGGTSFAFVRLDEPAVRREQLAHPRFLYRRRRGRQVRGPVRLIGGRAVLDHHLHQRAAAPEEVALAVDQYLQGLIGDLSLASGERDLDAVIAGALCGRRRLRH